MQLRSLVPKWYTLKKERIDDEGSKDHGKPIKGASSFLLSPLKPDELSRIQPFYNAEESLLSAEGAVLAARMGLEDWANVLDHKRKPVKYSAEQFDLMNYEDLIELGQEAVAISGQDEEQIKNS